MINNVTLVGRLTRDPELRYTPGGVAYTKVTLAINRPFPNKQTGEREADFVGVTVWGKQAENLSKFTGKGSLVGVVGRIQTGKYEKDGTTVYTFDVVAESVQFLDSKKSGVKGDNPFADDGAPLEVGDDDLPF
jgi:single-strand DNA-binding protein